MVKLNPNRVYYSSPAEAYDNYRVPIHVEEGYEPVMPKFFSMTNTPPFFEDPHSLNMCCANVTLKILVDIHTGNYVYELVNPERDVPIIEGYLSWFVDTFSKYDMDKEKDLAFQKIVTTRDYYKKWLNRIMASKERKFGIKNKKFNFFEGDK